MEPKAVKASRNVEHEEVEPRVISNPNLPDDYIPKPVKVKKSELPGCLGCILLVVALIAGVIYWQSGGERKVDNEAVAVDQGDAEAKGEVEKASPSETLVREFISETDVDKRLTMVRNPQLVKKHLGRYSDEALRSPGMNLLKLGMDESDGLIRECYSVSFQNGKRRLLNVLITDEGLKIDWDSYARYCSASWDTLSQDVGTTAELRVFAQPGNFYVNRYSDNEEWACFRLTNADWESAIYAYGQVGEETTSKVMQLLKQTDNRGEYMTLEVKSTPRQAGVCIVELKELLAVRWVVNYEKSTGSTPAR